jgi:hypothetical protein
VNDLIFFFFLKKKMKEMYCNKVVKCGKMCYNGVLFDKQGLKCYMLDSGLSR